MKKQKKEEKRISLRIPQDLNAKLEITADFLHRSVNSTIVVAIEEFVLQIEKETRI